MLFTALIGPYFVPWNDYRDYFEGKATALLGQPVEIRGEADLRVLPTPVLTFSDMRIGDGSQPYATIEHLRAEIELAALLKGEIRIVDMTIERPQLRIDLADLPPRAAEHAADGDIGLAERVSLADVEIVDGSADIAGFPEGRAWRVEGLSGVVEAGSLEGPYKVRANLSLDGVPVSISAALGRFSATDGLTAKVQAASPLYPATLIADGVVGLADGALKYEGEFTVAGIQPDEGKERTPWADFRAAGGFDLTAAALLFEEVQLSWGVLERPLVLQAAGRLDFGGGLRYQASVKARQIDIDYALGHDPENPVPVALTAATLARMLPKALLSPIPGALRLEAQGLVLGGSVIEDVRADLASEPAGWRVLDFEAGLPGDASVAARGMLALDPSPAFRGRVETASSNPAPLAAWLSGDAGEAAAIGGFDIAASVDISARKQAFTDIIAQVGRGALTGEVTFNAFPQSAEGTDADISKVNLAGDRVDLVALRALVGLLPAETLAAGQFDNLTIEFAADVLEAGGLEARSAVFAGVVEGGVLKLNNVTIDDLAGARVTASGHLRSPFDLQGGDIELSIDAADIGGAAAFLAALAPDSEAVAWLRKAAPRLSPIAADLIGATFDESGVTGITINATFGETYVDFAVDATSALSDLRRFAGDAHLTVDAPELGEVLNQLGLPTPREAAGPVHIEAEFSGPVFDHGTLVVKNTSSAAGLAVGYRAQSTVRDGALALEGDVDASSSDLGALLALAGFASPELKEEIAASVKGKLSFGGSEFVLEIGEAAFDGRPVGGMIRGRFGEDVRLEGALELSILSLPALVGAVVGASPSRRSGSWPDVPFAAALPEWLDIDLGLNAGVLDLGLAVEAEQAKLVAKFDDGSFDLRLEKADLADGKLAGSLAGAVDNGAIDVDLRVDLKGADLAPLVWSRVETPVASGRLDVAFSGSGQGRSMSGLVAGLNGSGTFAIADGRIEGLGPDALAKAAQLANADAEPDEDAILEIFFSDVGAGTIGFERADGTFSVSAGVVDVPTMTVDAAGATVMAAATVDLNTLTLSSEWRMRAEEAGTPADEPEPTVDVFFGGAMAQPDREFDVRPLIELVNLRYRLRQLQQIDELEEARRRAEEAEQLALPPGTEPVGPEPTTGVENGEPGPEAVSLPTRRPEPPVGDPIDLMPPSAAGEGESEIRRLAPAFEGLDVNR